MFFLNYSIFKYIIIVYQYSSLLHFASPFQLRITLMWQNGKVAKWHANGHYCADTLTDNSAIAIVETDYPIRQESLVLLNNV